MEKVQSIRDWFSILGWKKMPNFSSCHHATSWNEFKENYYCCAKLVELEQNIIETLKSGNNTSNARLTGVPGSGKTSFLYHLMKKAKYDTEDDLFEKFVFYVFHANKANDTESQYKKHTRQEILYGLESFYNSNNLQNVFDRIKKRNDLNSKGKINTLVKYYKDNVERFEKTLIFIIDDVDLLPEDLAFKIALAIIQDLEVRTIIKWISIRGVTFNQYSGEIKKFFEEFFPVVYNVPEPSLRDIVQYRIENLAGEKPKNPFSRELCDQRVIPLFEGNKRSSLSILKSILEDNLPKGTKEYSDEKFIKNHTDRVAINTFISKGALPNIHLEHLRTINFYPLPMDILACLQYSSNTSILTGSINEIMQYRCRRSPLWDFDRKLQLKSSDLSFSLDALVNENLIVRLEKNMFKLTSKGKILYKYLENETYIKRCLDLIPEIDKNPLYADFVQINVNYERTVKTYISWVDAHSPNRAA